MPHTARGCKRHKCSPFRLWPQIVILLDALDEADPPAPTTDPTASSTANAQRNRLVGASLDGGANARASADGGKATAGGGGGGVPVACGNGALALLTRQLSRLPAGLVRFFVTTTQEAAGGKVLSCLARTAQAQVGAGGHAARGMRNDARVQQYSVAVGGRVLSCRARTFQAQVGLEGWMGHGAIRKRRQSPVPGSGGHATWNGQSLLMCTSCAAVP